MPKSKRPPTAASPASRPPATSFTRATSPARWPSFSEENGGLFRYEDFAAYTAKLEEPVSHRLSRLHVYKNPPLPRAPPSYSRSTSLKAMTSRDGTQFPDYIHTAVEAVKLAMADRDKYLGDMDFITIPYRGLLSKEYANTAAP